MFANYKGENILDGEETQRLVLKQLAIGPKTYDNLTAPLVPHDYPSPSRPNPRKAGLGQRHK